jgi:hypothetical protein
MSIGSGSGFGSRGEMLIGSRDISDAKIRKVSNLISYDDDKENINPQ